MKTLLLAALCLFSVLPQDSNTRTLHNKDVLEMVEAKLSPEVIVATIKRSRCNFDTFPSVLTELKYKGVPDAVLMAMVEAPVGVTPKVAVKPPLPAQAAVVDEPGPTPASTRNVSPEAIQARFKGFNNSGRYRIKYDKFKDQTTIRVGPFFLSSTLGRMWSGKDLDLYLVMSFEGEILKDDPAAGFMFESHSKRWRFLGDHDMYILVDGKRFDLPRSYHEGDVGGGGFVDTLRGGVKEWVFQPLPAEVFRQIAKSSNVEIKVGTVELKLKDEHIEVVRNLYSLGR